MVINGESICPKCGGQLKHYDKVKRIVRTKYGKSYYIQINRVICKKCGSKHRAIPKYLLPYKHYEAYIINGFIDGTLTSYEIEFEDYPCESSIQKWKAQNKHF